MIRVLVGVVVGVAVAIGLGFAWTSQDPCLGRCAGGTRCEAARCVPDALTVVPSPAAPAPAKKKRRAATGEASASAEVQLRPGDTDRVTQGDALGRPEHLDLTEAGSDAKELSQDAMDRVLRGAEHAIVRCITTAIGDAPLDEGTIDVGLRIEKSGRVGRVRVDGPRLLQQRGLYACVKGVVTALSFPASNASTVATYPYAIR